MILTWWLPRDDHVGRLQVAVDHPPLVDGGEAPTDLARDVQQQALGDGADLLRELGERLALDQLHDQEVGRVLRVVDRLAADLERAHHVLVRDGDADRGLAGEALVGLVVRRLQELRVDDLDRHGIGVEVGRAGAVDDAHAAPTDLRLDPIAPDGGAEQGPPESVDRGPCPGRRP
jgi:hypothetical protein